MAELWYVVSLVQSLHKRIRLYFMGTDPYSRLLPLPMAVPIRNGQLNRWVYSAQPSFVVMSHTLLQKSLRLYTLRVSSIKP